MDQICELSEILVRLLNVLIHFYGSYYGALYGSH